MSQRIQKAIASSGYCSRRFAEKLILDSKVIVNGVIATIGMIVSDDDEIIIDGKKLEKEVFQYYLLDKPVKVVTTLYDPQNRRTVRDLIKTNIKLRPAGRLDYLTSGLVIMSNDGELINIITHPRNQVSKKYLVELYTNIPSNFRFDDKYLINGEEYCLQIKQINRNTCTVTLKEGKNREIRKVFSYLGFTLKSLKRISIGKLHIDSLNGKLYKALSKDEILDAIK